MPHEHFDVVTINLIISPVPVSNTWCAFIRANELFASNTESFVRVLLYAEDCIINSCMEIIVVTFYKCNAVVLLPARKEVCNYCEINKTVTPKRRFCFTPP